MNFFIKVLDDIDTEKVSGYTAWLIERIMARYSAEKLRDMWAIVEDI